MSEFSWLEQMLGMHGGSSEDVRRQRDLWARQQQQSMPMPFAYDQARAQRNYADALRGVGGFAGSFGLPVPDGYAEYLRQGAKGLVPDPEPAAVPETHGEIEVAQSLMDDGGQPLLEEWELVFLPVKPERRATLSGGFSGWDVVFLLALGAAWMIAGLLWL